MSLFHSTLSRRDFMKSLGLVGVGVGALTSQIFHDLDELASSDMANPKRPWFIRERELENPTMELDWSQIKRFTSTNSALSNNALYDTNYPNVLTGAVENRKKWILDNSPGCTLKDNALNNSVGLPTGSTAPWVPTATTPEKLGVPKYQGTPEENARILRSALRFFGAALIGYVPLTANTKNLVYSNGYTFEDTANGYLDTNKGKVIPNSGMTVIPVSSLTPVTSLMTAPSILGHAGNNLQNRLRDQATSSGSRFLAALGYDGLNGGIGPAPGFSCLAGGGEIARTGGGLISASYGIGLGTSAITTNLPLAPTHPIDAGIAKFCCSCANCAQVCPSSSIPTDHEPTWELPDYVYSKIPGNSAQFSIPGKKAFWFNASTCTSYSMSISRCLSCVSSCVFTKMNSSNIHETIKSIIANTPMLDGFFANMDQMFGYGNQEFKAGIGPPTGTFNATGVDWWKWELAPNGAEQRFFSNMSQ
ncbi:reductive dehalogenase [Dehalogenimonas sp. THU2]|uniref:reductive dehalogenase n=1 Tax=Dehalogenimonas sp. THU2 TaxID=3151121 RepID=UPI00321B5C86